MTYHVDISVERILQTAAKALELDGKLAEAHAARGVAFSAAERYDEANAEFNQALTFDPNSAETLYLYARSSVVQGKIEQATQLFERAAAADPNDYQSLC